MDTSGKLTIVGNQKGIALVYVAIAIFVLVGCLGLAVDVGHLQLVRGELQNAADATALAGAAQLYYVDPLNPGPPALNFDRAKDAAKSFVSQNKSDGAPLADGAISAGYWNLDNNVLQATTITPTSRDVPAVVVTVSRSDGSNGGPVPTFFAKVLGETWRRVAVSSRQAVAVSGFPGSAPPGELFPIALSSCMTDQYFSQNPLPDPPPEINVSSVYGPGGPGCYTGQWTSFQTGNSDVSTVEGLMNNGNPTTLQTGDPIWIEPGAKNALFNYLEKNWLPSGGKDVVMAVVGTDTGSITTHSEMLIKGFATFHIDGAVNGSSPYVYGHFIAFNSAYPGSMPGGPVSNTVTPPIMVQ